MAIYKMVGDKDGLEEVVSVSFGQAKVAEVADLQRMLRALPDVLEDGLLILAKEFSSWQDAKRRIDLLALDDTGRLVVIELKIGDTGAHMELQAIRYAAMVEVLTSADIIEAHQKYLNDLKAEGTAVEEEDAAESIRRRLEANDLEEIHTGNPRIMLVSEGFSTELTTSVLWLNERGLDITCIQLQAYSNGTELLLEASQVIPIPGTERLLVKRKEHKPDAAHHQPASTKTLQGGVDFKKTIDDRTPVHFHKGLNRLYDFACELELAGLVELSTHFNRKEDYVRLELRVPGNGQLLVSFNNLLGKGKERGGEITIWPNDEGVAPDSFGKFDQLIRPIKSRSKIRHRRLSTIPTPNLENVLSGIKEVYQEANSQLTTDAPEPAMSENPSAQG